MKLSLRNLGFLFRRFAFTLIELLVVVAIIGILAALLLSALARAKQQGWSARCKSNLRQMEIALRLYVDDNGERYPNTYVVWADNVTYWVDAIAPYYPLNWTNQAYHCPGYNGWITNSVPEIKMENGSPGPFYVGSYGYNGYGTGLDQMPARLGLGSTTSYLDPNRFPTILDSRVRAPSEMIALADTELWFWGGSLSGFQPWGSFVLEAPPAAPSAAQVSGAYPPRHGNNYNVTCCDGHVEAMPPSRLFSPQASAVRWNWDHLPHRETWREL